MSLNISQKEIKIENHTQNSNKIFYEPKYQIYIYNFCR